MRVTDSIPVSTRGDAHMIDLTAKLQAIVDKHAIEHGQALVFVSGSTAGLTTVEYEPGLIQDLPEAFERWAPQDRHYHHPAPARRWRGQHGGRVVTLCPGQAFASRARAVSPRP